MIGILFPVTVAPVGCWTTICLMPILSLVFGPSPWQNDYAAAFLYSPIEEDGYIELHRRLTQPGKVLNLKLLNSHEQAPRNSFQHLQGNSSGLVFLTISPADPCLSSWTKSNLHC
jgi:hypothetical protein